MIRGYIKNNSCYLNIRIRGRRKPKRFKALIDTGSEGYVTLPISKAINLGLELVGRWNIGLADGSVVHNEPVFDGALFWDGEWIKVKIDLTDSKEALIGTSLFSGYKITLNYATNEVLIERIVAE